MVHRYSTALSHLFSAALGLYCFKRSTDDLPLVAYAIVLLNSLIGIWKWGNPAHGYRLESLYNLTRKLQTLFVFACIVGQLWLNQNESEEVAYTHPALSIIPLIFYLCNFNKPGLIDFLTRVNILSCCYVSYYTENYFGVSAAVSYTINHFILRDDGELFDMPCIDFHNYAFCFFSYFSLKALQGPL